MSTISALKVFSLFGQKIRHDPAQPARDNLALRDASMANSGDSSTPPPWFVDAMTKNRDEIKTAIREELGGLKDEVAAIKEEQQIQATNIRDVDHRVDQAFAEIAALRNLLEGKSARPVPVPVQCTVGDQCSVAAKFQGLLSQASTMSGCYAAGLVPPDKVTGVRPSPKTFKFIAENYFPNFRLKILASAGVSKIVRFTVEPVNSANTKTADFEAVLKSTIMSVRGDGWWIQQELPPTLRQMYSNAYQFFKSVKAEFKVLRPYVFDAQDGYITIDGTKVVPVYLVPKNRAVWKDLGGVLLNIVASFLTVDWLDSMVGQLTVDQSHVDEWVEIVSAKLVEKPGNATARLQSNPEASTAVGASNVGDTDMDTENSGG
jgi:hypothetical protein